MQEYQKQRRGKLLR